MLLSWLLLTSVPIQSENTVVFTLHVELSEKQHNKTTITKPDRHKFAWKLAFNHEYDSITDNHILVATVCNPDGTRNAAKTGIQIYINDHDKKTNASVYCDFGAVQIGDGIKFKWLLNTTEFRQLCIGRGLSIIYEIEYESISDSKLNDDKTLLPETVRRVS